MSKDKYPNMSVKSNGGYCVCFPLNIFFVMQDLMKNGKYNLDIP